MPRKSLSFSCFSPPFPSVFSYTSLPEDLGNSEELRHEVKLHFSFFFRSILPIIKPGRAMVVHCCQIARLKRSGEEGMFDFRGFLIRLAIRAGFTYEYDWVVRKNPQAQALRTKKWELKFQGLETDRARSRGAMPDYLIKFRAPGDNAVPVNNPNEVTRNDWINWAECCWDDIRETDTLNVAEGRSEKDTRHICPLQLPIINRLVRLYTNPGEIVFSPFAGIGSEGYEALKLGRRFYGCELKQEYYNTALLNLERAIKLRTNDSPQMTFDSILNPPKPEIADESVEVRPDATATCDQDGGTPDVAQSELPAEEDWEARERADARDRADAEAREYAADKELMATAVEPKPKRTRKRKEAVEPTGTPLADNGKVEGTATPAASPARTIEAVTEDELELMLTHAHFRGGAVPKLPAAIVRHGRKHVGVTTGKDTQLKLIPLHPVNGPFIKPDEFPYTGRAVDVGGEVFRLGNASETIFCTREM
jgi:hypothetical protein